MLDEVIRHKDSQQLEIVKQHDTLHGELEIAQETARSRDVILKDQSKKLMSLQVQLPTFSRK